MDSVAADSRMSRINDLALEQNPVHEFWNYNDCILAVKKSTPLFHPFAGTGQKE